MHVNHLNCGTMRPAWRRKVEGSRSIKQASQLVCHCLLIESDEGLILVDTGIGEERVSHTRSLQVIRPIYHPSETAARQITALGYNREDVRHIILTHLDIDHAGGLRDFPGAQVHVFGPEFRAATAPTTWGERIRYRQNQWEHGVNWLVHELNNGDRWFGFESVRTLPKVRGEIFLVPLAGHTRGHIGVAVRKESGGDSGWLLHAGDAYFSRREIESTNLKPARWLMAFETMIQFDGKARIANRLRLSELVAEYPDEISVFSSHDCAEFDQLQPQKEDEVAT